MAAILPRTPRCHLEERNWSIIHRRCRLRRHRDDGLLREREREVERAEREREKRGGRTDVFFFFFVAAPLPPPDVAKGHWGVRKRRGGAGLGRPLAAQLGRRVIYDPVRAACHIVSPFSFLSFFFVFFYFFLPRPSRGQRIDFDAASNSSPSRRKLHDDTYLPSSSSLFCSSSSPSSSSLLI